MPDIKQHIRIPKNVAANNDLDFSFLRQKGLEYIQQLSGQIWTDFNSHDPGVTILEMLCYAITDLGQRIELPPENLLAPENKEAQKITEQFFTASQILPSAPVTENDYRKLFVDIDGVRNCWLKPYEKTVYVDCKQDKISYNKADFNSTLPQFKQEFILKGLYSVLVDYADEIQNEPQKQQIHDEIFRRFHANRNLCEDLIEVLPVDEQPVGICAIIEVSPEVDEELVHARVLNAIDRYLSPDIQFWSLNQLLGKGYKSDEIFEGPLLNHGFIDNQELEKSALRTEVRVSDIIQEIMAVEGVTLVRDIIINNCTGDEDNAEKWLICIDPGKKPVRCEKSVFSYYKGLLPVNVNSAKVVEYQKMLLEEEKKNREEAKWNRELDIPEGEFMSTSETTTIQNDFPDTYGTGRNGLPSGMPVKRKAQAKQLKGYLLFFDQILASYFAHLGKVKDLLSVDNRLRKTYFTQAVNDLKDLQQLVTDYPLDDQEELTALLFSDFDNHSERKNQILDHLLARFAEKLGDYAFLMKRLYGEKAGEVVLKSKESFLSDYHLTSRQRGSAFNYFNQPPENLWDTNNVSGFEKRLARLCGIKNHHRRFLSESFVEIYMPDSVGEETVYRWRIRNTQNDIVLSSTVNYENALMAGRECNLAVEKIIETPVRVIEDTFKKEVPDNTVAGNFEVQLSPGGKYSFNIINPKAKPGTTAWVIARHYKYYHSKQELKNAVLELIDFITGDFTEEGVFVVEHILLRPDVTQTIVPQTQFFPVYTDNCSSCSPIDPYSYRITVVLPGWTYRFSNPDFRKFLEDLIRKELPAHVLARICWVGNRKIRDSEGVNDMQFFEESFRNFLLSKTSLEQVQDEPSLTELIKALGLLNTIYPPGILTDCSDESEELEGRIVLGKTSIGNF